MNGDWTRAHRAEPTLPPSSFILPLHASRQSRFATPEVRIELEKQALIPVGSSPEEFSAFLQKDVVRYGGIAKKIGFQPQ